MAIRKAAGLRINARKRLTGYQRGYSTSTINFYSCTLAAVGAYVIWRPEGLLYAMTSSTASVLWCMGTGVLTCFVPYLLYTYGLIGLENSRASILASVEPVVASLIGVFVYHEKMTVLSV
ncbi:MAG: DMT family transporter, partial [Lachnospiraceae bacterium]|nr:DMT family transporter [Lachnospiraceae bacterium]